MPSNAWWVQYEIGFKCHSEWEKKKRQGSCVFWRRSEMKRRTFTFSSNLAQTLTQYLVSSTNPPSLILDHTIIIYDSSEFRTCWRIPWETGKGVDGEGEPPMVQGGQVAGGRLLSHPVLGVQCSPWCWARCWRPVLTPSARSCRGCGSKSKELRSKI